MNKLTILISILLIALAAWYLLSKEDLNLQETEEPGSKVETVPADIQSHIDSKADLIKINSPKPMTVVNNPIEIEGEARGYWFFEASFPIFVTNWDGLIIGQGIATAKDDWMTEDFVSFTAEIEFTLPEEVPKINGTLIFKKDNPSGLPENDDALEIPILFE